VTRPVITILTNERDFAADEVIFHLSALGAQVDRVNIEAARTAPARPWSPGDLSPTVVWWRQFEAEPSRSSVGDVDDALVERAQWRTWLSTLDDPGSCWVNPLWAARRAESKVEQLRVASRLGFNVPPTLVTNDRQAAQRFAVAHGEVVVKTLASAYFSFTDQSFVFTESFDHPALTEAERWHATPLIVQQRLGGALDARVVSFGDHTYGGRCHARGLDWRKTPYDPNLWEQFAVPESLATMCRRFRVELGLEYAAFDFMLDRDRIWFLEANQAGEFSFLDRALRLGLSEAFAKHLCNLGTGCG
jgi:glutathione synthase/RimK-type ligase-like ATP-grasp enzyme